MNSQTVTYHQNRIHPHKFALWASFASIFMLFAALTSAYLVRKAVGNWLEYTIPNIFFISTAILLVSSLTLHRAYKAFKQQREIAYKGMLIASFVLGSTFIVMQYYGWMALYSQGITLDGNPSGSFFYVISGLHAVHILGGISAIIVAMIHGFSLKFRSTEKRITRFSLVVQYWHFVDLLWLYLFVFLLLTQ